MFFHYTTRYDDLFIHTTTPTINVPWGHLGVNLFFMISGFVIFMTLDKTERPTDFVVSRFSRLFPAYWVAIWLTFVVVHQIGLPGKEHGVATAVGNMLMLHSLFHIANIDGVYWTLEVELLFYIAMLGLWSAGLLKRVHLVGFTWLAARAIYLAMEQFAGIDLPYLVSRVLILQYIPYFLMGVTAFTVYRRQDRPTLADLALLGAAILTIAAGEGWQRALVSIAIFALVALAIFRPPAVLRARLLIWLGAISFPIYLLHESIGWSVILFLEDAGLTANLAICAAIVVSLTMADVLHRWIELPVMNVIRTRYREFRRIASSADWRPGRWASACVAMLALLTVLSFVTRASSSPPPAGVENLAHIQTPRSPISSCQAIAGGHPLVLLALGQSNAGNHGEPDERSPEVTVIDDGGCLRTRAPLPGATGDGGSIWPRLANELERQYPGRRALIAVLAVDSTEVLAWSQPGPLQDRLRRKVSSLAAEGLLPNAVLWQQGEMDAQAGTSAEDYIIRFTALLKALRGMGVDAPVFVAQSTYCRGDGFGVVRRAQQRLLDRTPGLAVGAQTDTLMGAARWDECHFSEAGLQAAAALWASALSSAPELAAGGL
jgi:peptidoglycan/LPS O-acetylase OafA/YrhL